MKYLYNNNNNFPSSFSLNELLKYLSEVNIEIAPKKFPEKKQREVTDDYIITLDYYGKCFFHIFLKKIR